jgi:hypothetical protein
LLDWNRWSSPSRIFRAVFEQDGAAALWRSGFWCSLPQQYPFTPGGPEQDPTGIFSDEQRAVIAGAAPMMGEEAGDLLLRLAAEVQRVAGGG